MGYLLFLGVVIGGYFLIRWAKRKAVGGAGESREHDPNQTLDARDFAGMTDEQLKAKVDAMTPEEFAAWKKQVQQMRDAETQKRQR